MGPAAAGQQIDWAIEWAVFGGKADAAETRRVILAMRSLGSLAIGGFVADLRSIVPPTQQDVSIFVDPENVTDPSAICPCVLQFLCWILAYS